MPTAGLDQYKSARQRIRVSSEAWGESNLFCVNCDSPALVRTRTNTPAIDFTCPRCDAFFQLKSHGRKLGPSIPDGAYSKMSEAIAEDRTPNLLALHYEPEEWRVHNLILVPQFSYSLSVIKKRSGSHERSIRELIFENGAVRVGGPLARFHGVLTGVPTYMGGSQDLGGDGDMERKSRSK